MSESFIPYEDRPGHVVHETPAPVKISPARALGKAAPKHDPRTLKMSAYLHKAALPVPPVMKNWGEKVPEWGMMVNDQIGDCTCAAAGHLILMDTTYRGKPFKPNDAQIVEAYHNVTGYLPGKPDTDNGAVELDVLNYWRKTGIAGHQIGAFVSVPVGDARLIRTAIWLFGAIYAGVALPLSAQAQTASPEEPSNVWKLTGTSGDGEPNSWGGHAVPLIGYDSKSFACVTWGAMQWMTEDWWTTYGDEAYAIIRPDWVPPEGAAPNSFNLDQLKADLAQI